MDKLLKILIVDDNSDSIRKYYNIVEEMDSISILDNTDSFSDALLIVKSDSPDIVILDLELHNGSGNGITFLSQLHNSNLTHTPYIIIATNNSSATTLRYARTLGADYIFSKYEKDFSENKIINFISTMSPAIISPPTAVSVNDNAIADGTHKTIISYLSKEFYALGITPKLKGYKYLIDAAILICENSVCDYCTLIAKSYNKSRASVERAMQNAIIHAWTCCDSTEIAKHYTARISNNKNNPTLMEFVYYYADVIKNTLLIN